MLGIVVFFLFLFQPPVAAATEAGGGCARQLWDNTDLLQYEMFVREPLPYKTIVADTLLVSSVVELGIGIIRESQVEHSEVGKVSLMPELVLRPYDRIHYLVGLGAGLMAGETKFTKHDLGGPFFLASKLGLRLLIGKGWGLEYIYYHQSNAGIYEHNASLNMLQAAIFSTF